MRTPFSRFSLLRKIVLSTSVAITVLFAIAGWIAVRSATRATSESISREAQSSFQAYKSLWKSRAERLASISLVLSNMSDVRGVFGTGDEATIRDTAGELWARVSEEDAVFLVATPRGRVIASLGGGSIHSMPGELPEVPQAAGHFPAQATGFLVRNGQLEHLTITPVYVQATGGEALIDVLVAGYAIDDGVAAKLKAATGGSEFLFLAEGRVLASTLSPAASAAIARQIPSSPARVTAGGSEYAPLITALAGIDGKNAGSLAVLRSVDAANRAIADLRWNISLLWLCSLVAGLALTYMMARRVVGPLEELDRAATEVARQNYNSVVTVKSDDELGRLGATFNAMCASIRQAREELIRSERISTIGRLAASIVHDLRNPLAAIYGGAEMLMDSKLSEAQVQRLAHNMYSASERIQQMLQDLLELGGGKTGSRAPANLRELAARVAESFSQTAEAQSVRISVDAPEDLVVPLDGRGIERVLANLVGNALQAMPGGGAIAISARCEEEGSVVIAIRDTGPGIAPEVRDRLFQPFVTTRKGSGLGLGLALSRQAVIDHGGDMWAESTPGGGACFSFRLPRLAGDFDATKSPASGSK